jgi:hypothetical protein
MSDITHQTLLQGATPAARVLLSSAADNGAPTLVTQGFALGCVAALNTDGRMTAPPAVLLRLATTGGTYCRFRLYWWNPIIEAWAADANTGLVQIDASDSHTLLLATSGHSRIYIRTEALAGGAVGSATGSWQSDVMPGAVVTGAPPTVAVRVAVTPFIDEPGAFNGEPSGEDGIDCTGWQYARATAIVTVGTAAEYSEFRLWTRDLSSQVWAPDNRINGNGLFRCTVGTDGDAVTETLQIVGADRVYAEYLGRTDADVREKLWFTLANDPR